VKFSLKEPQAWFLDLLASTSTWIVAKECVEKFGDLKKAESVVGTGPWMLERYEPNRKLVFARNPNYFVPGLPYADGVEVTVDPDPASRPRAGLPASTTSGPVPAGRAAPDLEVARRSRGSRPPVRGSRRLPRQSSTRTCSGTSRARSRASS
jgi:ABC-type transport system substrate-binding protein